MEIEKNKTNQEYSEKLFKDALYELSVLHNYIKTIPEYTRETFEKEEKEYFELKAKKDILGIKEGLELLMAIGVDIKTIDKIKDFETILNKTNSVNNFLE